MYLSPQESSSFSYSMSSCKCQSLFTQSPLLGHLGSFQLILILQWKTYVFVLLTVYPQYKFLEVGLLGQTKGIFLFYGCVTSYHTLSSLKQHLFISSRFCRSEVWASTSGLSTQNITRHKPKILTVILSGGSRKNPLPGKSSGRIQFPFCCGHSASTSLPLSLPHDPSNFKPETVCWIVLAWNLTSVKGKQSRKLVKAVRTDFNQ